MRTNGMRCELLEVEGTFNVRDLGGYKGENGRTVQKRRFIRAGSLSGLTTAGRRQVAELGVDCILDLRSQAEAEKMPDAISGLKEKGVSYRHISMLDYIQSNFASGDFTTFPKSMAEMYVGLLDRAQEQFRRIFRIFADKDVGLVLFHCTAGKDRTGLVTMLLLLLAGVSEEDVAEDYSWSEALVGPINSPPGAPELPHYLFESRRESIRAAMDHLHQAYGGVVAYLKKIGLTEEEIQSVKRKLLDA